MSREVAVRRLRRHQEGRHRPLVAACRANHPRRVASHYPSLCLGLLRRRRPASAAVIAKSKSGAVSASRATSALPSVMAPVMSTLGLMIHESSPRPRCREGADDVARGAQSGDRARHVGEEVVAGLRAGGDEGLRAGSEKLQTRFREASEARCCRAVWVRGAGGDGDGRLSERGDLLRAQRLAVLLRHPAQRGRAQLEHVVRDERPLLLASTLHSESLYHS